MSKTKSPFKDNKALQSQISGFLANYGAVFAQEASRTSAFFEVAVYNDLVAYYASHGFSVTPRDLSVTSSGAQFVYAMSPSANPSKCSFFEVVKAYKRGQTHSYEVRHNVRIQSAHDPAVFVSPDYAVLKPGALQSVRLKHYYNGKVDYHFVPASSVLTFAETKHYMPSPELILNFVGIVNELKPDLLAKKYPSVRPFHFSPTLFVSGAGSFHTKAIQASLSSRYNINVLLGLFVRPTQLYAKRNRSKICKVGSY